MHPIVSNAFGERVVIDLKDFNSYIEGAPYGSYRYLMCIVDHYSGWVVAYGLRDKTAESVMKKMEKYFCLHGVPKIVHSDNGGVFRLYAIM